MVTMVLVPDAGLAKTTRFPNDPRPCSKENDPFFKEQRGDDSRPPTMLEISIVDPDGSALIWLS